MAGDGVMGFQDDAGRTVSDQEVAMKSRAALERAEADLAKAREESSVPSLSIAKEEMEIAKTWMQIELLAGGEGRRD